MTGFVADGQPMENPLESATSGYLDTPPTEGERFGAMFGQNSITGMLWRKAQRDEVSNRDLIEQTPPPLSADEANKQYAPVGPDGNQVKITDKPLDPDMAKLIGNAKTNELDREGVLERGSKVHSGLNSFAVGTAAFMADPINLAATFIPGIGEENVLAGMGRVGLATTGFAARTAARGVAGATMGAAGQIPLSALHYGLGQQEASDYSLRDAFKDVEYGAAGGAILQAGFGAAHDAWKSRGSVLHPTPPAETMPEASAVMDAPAPVKAAAMKSSVSQIVSGREVDPASVISGDLPLLAEKQRLETASGYAPSLTGDELAQAKEQILPDVEKPKAEAAAKVEQPVVDRYKHVLQDEANRLGIPLDDAALNQAATDMATSHTRPTAEETAPKSVAATPGVVAAAEATPAPKIEPVESFPNLPKELTKGSPRYKQSELAFGSDVDKALYIVRERSSGRSKAHDRYMDYLQNTVGLSKEEISKGSEDVKAAVQAHAEGAAEGKVSVPKTFTRNPEPLTKAEPIPELTHAGIEQKFANKINNHYEQAKAEYQKLPDTGDGKVVSTDSARELSEDYLADRSKAAAVHEPASAFAKKYYAEKLAEAPKAGEEPEVLFTGGGTGAGKTRAVESVLQDVVKKSQIVYDTNMNKFGSAKEKIDQALAAGKNVTIVYVYREPVDSLVNGALKRATSQEAKFGTGRTVPIEEHVNTHVGSRETIDKLEEHYKGDKRVAIKVIDNSHGRNGATDTSLDKIPVVPREGLSEKLNDALTKERDNGNVSERTYNGFKKQSSETGREHSAGNGERVEQLHQAGTAEPAPAEAPSPAAQPSTGKPGTEPSDHGTTSTADQLTSEQAEIAQLQSKIDVNKMTSEERAELSGAAQLADTLQADYQTKLKAWTDCLAGVA